MELNKLPPELLLKIFSFMTNAELSNLIARVCKTWKTFAFDPILWQRLTYNEQVYETKHQRSLTYDDLNRCSALRDLTIIFCTKWHFIQNLVNCPLIKKIYLYFCSGLTATHASNLVKYCPNVEDFTIQANDILEFDTIEEIVKWKKLKKLCFNHSVFNAYYAWDESYFAILLAEECKNLEILDINNLQFSSSRPLKILAKHLGPKLKALHVKMMFDIKLLEKFTRLTDLRLMQSQEMNGQELCVVRDFVHGRQDFKSLEIMKGFLLTADDLSNFFKTSSLIHLVTLNLMGCVNTDNTVIEAIVKCCPSLRKLSLAMCHLITEKGIEEIANNCKLLAYLNLGWLKKITCVCLINSDLVSNLVVLQLPGCDKVSLDTIRAIKKKNEKLLLISGK